MNLHRRILYPVTGIIIFAYFLFFTWRSVRLYFDQDDMYNLYFAWSKSPGEILDANVLFWNAALRPMGALWYRALFAGAGLHPLPFHISLLTICACNIVLCFWLTHLITRSERTAALASLIFAFHTRLIEVWFNTAMIYDVLCFTFLYLALCLYISGRRNQATLTKGRIAAIVGCFLCALNAKEMAVCFPVFLAAFELLINRPPLRTLLRSRAALLIVLACLMIVPYAAAKLHGANAMSNNPAYTPEYSYARFIATWTTYLTQLFVRNSVIPEWAALAALGGLLIGALTARSNQLLFAWIVLFFGLIPVTFSPPRGPFVLYISYPGWTLYAASVLVAVQDLITQRVPQYRTAVACAMFVLVGWRLGKMNLHDQRADPRPWLYSGRAAVRTMTEDMSAMHSQFPRNARILLEEDGFTTDEWTPLFIFRLLYRNRDLMLDRTKISTVKPAGWRQNMSAAPGSHYDFVFTYEAGRYRQISPAASSAR